jgi:hypothetical protein
MLQALGQPFLYHTTNLIKYDIIGYSINIKLLQGEEGYKKASGLKNRTTTE